MAKDYIFEVLIEDQHLAGLHNLKKRLYTEDRMDGDLMRDWAQRLDTIIKYIEGCIEPAQLKQLEEDRKRVDSPLTAKEVEAMFAAKDEAESQRKWRKNGGERK